MQEGLQWFCQSTRFIDDMRQVEHISRPIKRTTLTNSGYKAIRGGGRKMLCRSALRSAEIVANLSEAAQDPRGGITMFRPILVVSIALSAVALAPGAAATLYATNANFKTVFYSAKAGDIVRLSGTFGRTAMMNRSFSRTVTIDARAATFTEAISFANIGNVILLGGHYGTRARKSAPRIQISNSKMVSIIDVAVTNNHGGHGVDVRKSSEVTVSGGTFTNIGLGVGFTAVTKGKIYNNKSVGSVSDGFNVVDSHSVLVSHNSCTGTTLNPGSKTHPDCVQLWSIKGNPVQSDIEISDNFASGATQGFTSFNAFAGGGLRIKMLRNRVDTSYPQGIACYSCVDSEIIGNVITTQAGARWKTRMNIIGGRNNTVSGNSIGPFTKPDAGLTRLEGITIEGTPWDEVKPLAALATFGFIADEDYLDFRSAAVGNDAAIELAATVPEPAAWIMLVSGFGLAGVVARRRRRKVVTA